MTAAARALPVVETPYLTCAEAAAYLRLHTPAAIRVLVLRGQLKPVGRGGRGRLLFTRDVLDLWVRRRDRETPDSVI